MRDISAIVARFAGARYSAHAMRWLLVISISLAGCRDREEMRLEKVKAAVCACKTSGCAELAMKDIPKDDIKASRKSQDVARQMLDCLSRLYDAERPVTDPDAEASP
jgi:hypothetical protein